MPTDVSRIKPNPAFRGAAVRRPGSRRQRPGDQGRNFQEEIAMERGGEKADPAPPPEPQSDRIVSPPTDEDGGTRINLLG